MEKMKKKKNILIWLNRVFVILVCFVTGSAVRLLPDIIPIHYDSIGNVDGYGLKNTVYILIATMIVMAIVFEIMIGHYSKKASLTENEKEKYGLQNLGYMFSWIALASSLILTMSLAFMLVGGFKGTESLNDFTFRFESLEAVAIGFMLVLLGNACPKTRRNGTFGVRTGWSMYNDVTWYKSNKFGGAVLMIDGLISILGGALFERTAVIVLMLGPLLISLIPIIIYSKKVYNEEKVKEHEDAEHKK